MSADPLGSFTCRHDLGAGWEHVRAEVGSAWLGGGPGPTAVEVALPHSWNAHDTFLPRVTPYLGPGAYRRRFRMPSTDPAEHRWFLVSGGFYGTGEVWLDGRRLAEVDGQYLGFELDLGDRLAGGGDHLVAVRLTNRCRRYILPGHRCPDFILHGGLTGAVALVRRPTLRFDHLDHGRVAVRTRLQPGGGGEASITWEVVADRARPSGVTVRWRVVDAAGRVVGESDQQAVAVAAAGRGATQTTTVAIAAVQPWSPATPALYLAAGELDCDGVVVDRVTVRFGFRQLDFRAGDGLLLNGERLRLAGVNRHEAIPGFGQALPDLLQRADAELIKDTGCNFVRLAHCPQQSAFLDACDELGLLVYAEIATWKSVRSGRWLLRALAQMEGMVVRDRNHPSVALWGMGNESRSRRAYQLLGDLARRLDPTRPVSYAENHLHRARLNRTTGLPDVWGVNYELDRAEDGARAARSGTALVSECVDFPSYHGAPRGVVERELGHLRAVAATLDALDRLPSLVGWAVWCLADYATMRQGQYQRHCGLFDAWREPKLAAFLLRARLATAPFLTVVGSWGAVGEGENDPGWRDLQVFTTCRRVRLTAAHEVVEIAVVGGHASCRVPYVGGELVATGEGGLGPAVHRLAAYGRPRALRLAVAAGPLGQPVRVDLAVVDEQGVVVAWCAGEAEVDVVGTAVLHTTGGDGRVTVARGSGRTWLTATAPGDLELTGRWPGIGATTLTWRPQAAPTGEAR